MLSLNYHHLRYFWSVVRNRGVGRASRELGVSQPTISAQLHELEAYMGGPLFERAGRELILTEFGRSVYRYAQRIFAIGQELTDMLRGKRVGTRLNLVVGIAEALPKLVAQRLIEPALKMDMPTRVICREDRPERLLADMAVHEVDLVLSDSPAPPSVRVKAFNHYLGDCGVTFFAVPSLARRYRKGFPRSLEGAPVLLPTENTNLRRSLDEWLDAIKLSPQIVGEFEDSALMKDFGRAGLGIFAAPTLIEDDVRAQFQVQVLGRTETVKERFYIVTIDRTLKHPAVVAISDVARQQLSSLRPCRRSRRLG